MYLYEKQPYDRNHHEKGIMEQKKIYWAQNIVKTVIRIHKINPFIIL